MHMKNCKRGVGRTIALIITIIIMVSSPLRVFAYTEEPALGDEENILFELKEDNSILTIRKINEWDSGYNGEIIIHNISTGIIEDWNLFVSTDDTIVNMWNCNYSIDDLGINVAPLDYNKVIYVDSDIVLGFQADGTKQNISANISVTKDQKNDEQGFLLSDIPDESIVYETDLFSVEYKITSKWDEVYNAEIQINNLSEETIHNWNIIFPTEDAILDVYNASVISNESEYLFKNLGYNQDILPGSSVSFGFRVQFGLKADIPQVFRMNYNTTILSDDSYSIEKYISNEWESGYTGELRITNTGNEKIEDWYLVLECDNPFVNIWGASIVQHSGVEFIIQCPDDKQCILPGETVIVGFQMDGILPDNMNITALYDRNNSASGNNNQQGENGNSENQGGNEGYNAETEEAYIVLTSSWLSFSEDTGLYSTCEDVCELNGEILNLDDIDSVTYQMSDVNYNSICEGKLIENQNHSEEHSSDEINENGQVSEMWSVDPFGMVLGVNRLNFEIKLKGGDSVQEEFILINTNIDNMSRTELDIADNDGDGINNYFEQYFLTNQDEADTDNDGLSDYDELFKISFNPLEQDTNSDGVSDFDDDSDEDGLCVGEELNRGTNAFLADTDEDGLEDGEEISVYHTNPLLYDTDGDGFSDGEEISLGLNPNSADSDGNGIADEEELILQEKRFSPSDENGPVNSVSVKFSCKGSIQDAVYYNDYIGAEFVEGTPGLVGGFANIDVVSEFDKAWITFSYDETKLGDTNEEDLRIVWYDEINHDYVLLEDSVCDAVNNTVTYETDHFSIYFLVDVRKWQEARNKVINYISEGRKVNKNYDFIITMDYTLTSAEFSKQEKIIESIIEQMEDGDRMLFIYVTEDGTSCRGNAGKWQWNTTKSTARSAMSINNFWDAFYGRGRSTTGTHEPAIELAFQSLGLVYDDNENEKVVFMFYGGTANASRIVSYKSVINQELSVASSNNAKVNVVSIGSGLDANLPGMIGITGGKSYSSENEGTENGIKEDLSNRITEEDGFIDTKDSDGDGLYDVYEINGMMGRNGRIYYTNPQKKDSDDDGSDDFEEMGGLPDDNGLFRVIGDPNKVEVYALFEVDNVSEYILSQKKRNSIYEDVVSYNKKGKQSIVPVDEKGNNIHGLINIYRSNLNELTKEEQLDILTRGLIEVELGSSLYYASDFLEKFLNPQSVENRVYSFSMEKVFGHSNNYTNAYYSDLNLLISRVIEMDCFNTPVTFHPKDTRGVQFTPLYFDGFAAIHNADTNATVKVSFENGEYTLEYTHFVIDYYDWDPLDEYPIGIVSPNDMYRLERCGLGRSYLCIGTYTDVVKWNEYIPDDNSREAYIESNARLGAMKAVEKAWALDKSR